MTAKQSDHQVILSTYGSELGISLGDPVKLET